MNASWKKCLLPLHAVWLALSSCLASLTIFAAFALLAALSQGMSFEGFVQNKDLSTTFDLCLKLSVAVGVATFLSVYVLNGSIYSYATVAFISLTMQSHNATVMTLIVTPAILGGILGHYFNRYTFHAAAKTEKTPAAGRIATLIICVAIVFAIVSHSMPSVLVGVLWLGKTAIMLTGAVHLTVNRSATSLAA